MNLSSLHGPGQLGFVPEPCVWQRVSDKMLTMACHCRSLLLDCGYTCLLAKQTSWRSRTLADCMPLAEGLALDDSPTCAQIFCGPDGSGRTQTVGRDELGGGGQTEERDWAPKADDGTRPHTHLLQETSSRLKMQSPKEFEGNRRLVAEPTIPSPTPS